MQFRCQGRVLQACRGRHCSQGVASVSFHVRLNVSSFHAMSCYLLARSSCTYGNGGWPGPVIAWTQVAFEWRSYELQARFTPSAQTQTRLQVSLSKEVCSAAVWDPLHQVINHSSCGFAVSELNPPVVSSPHPALSLWVWDLEWTCETACMYEWVYACGCVLC